MAEGEYSMKNYIHYRLVCRKCKKLIYECPCKAKKKVARTLCDSCYKKFCGACDSELVQCQECGEIFCEECAEELYCFDCEQCKEHCQCDELISDDKN